MVGSINPQMRRGPGPTTSRSSASFRRIGSVAPGPLDDLVCDRDGELAAGIDIAAIMDTVPDARLGGGLSERRECVGVAGKR